MGPGKGVELLGPGSEADSEVGLAPGLGVDSLALGLGAGDGVVLMIVLTRLHTRSMWMSMSVCIRARGPVLFLGLCPGGDTHYRWGICYALHNWGIGSMSSCDCRSWFVVRDRVGDGFVYARGFACVCGCVSGFVIYRVYACGFFYAGCGVPFYLVCAFCIGDSRSRRSCHRS